MRLTRRYSGTLFFFPALLPLAALLPWLLTALGGVAALASFSLPRFLRQYRAALTVFGILCVAAGAGVYMYHRPPQILIDHGTRPAPTVYTPVPAAAPAPVAASAPAAAFTKLWHAPTERQILSTPVLSGGMLVYGTFNNTVEAMVRDNGAPAWTLPVKNPVFAIGTGPDGTVYAAEGLHDTTAASLIALDAQNGRVKWARQFLGHLEEESALDSAHNLLFTSAGPGGLWALALNDGAVLWHRPLGHIDSKALVHNGIVYVPANTDEKVDKTVFYALNAATGAVLWELPQPGKPWGSPLLAADGRTILTTTGNGQIGVEKDSDKGWSQGISLDGKLLWEVELPGMALQPSVYIAAADTLVHTTKNGFIVAQSARDGKIIWQEKAANEFQAPAVYGNGLLAAVDFDGNFTIRKADDGTVLSALTVNNQSTSSPVIDGDVIYVAGAYGVTAFTGLHALDRP